MLLRCVTSAKANMYTERDPVYLLCRDYSDQVCMPFAYVPLRVWMRAVDDVCISVSATAESFKQPSSYTAQVDWAIVCAVAIRWSAEQRSTHKLRYMINDQPKLNINNSSSGGSRQRQHIRCSNNRRKTRALSLVLTLILQCLSFSVSSVANELWLDWFMNNDLSVWWT